MKRNAYKKLLTWKKNPLRKPLILQGARQVGKTYLVKYFGKVEYKNSVYLNFEEDSGLIQFFEGKLNPHEIISNISLYIGENITSENTLIFFDEIQIAPRVLLSLKYFQENASEFHIIAAGSLLGVSVGKDSGFPVGKVNFLTLFPLSFEEYLGAAGEGLVCNKLQSISKAEPLPEMVHQKLTEHLKLFLYLGGMPEVVNNYLTNKNIEQVRVIQNEILEAYKRDFSKYADKNQAIRTSEFWNSIPQQLARDNKKFKYADIKKNARSATYESTVEWLRNAGLINIVHNCENPKLPISAYTNYSKFKVYMHDVGLLAAELNIASASIVSPDKLFSEFNGLFIENFVAQELRYYGFNKLYYWTSKSDAEVDFIIDNQEKIFPVEVKSGLSKNTKSIRSYASKYNPELLIRISSRNLTLNDDFLNIPLYAVNLLKIFTAE